MRTAVIAVHGVADQQAGQTADSIAELLVSSEPNGSIWQAIGSQPFILNVAPLDPDTARGIAAPDVAKDASPSSASRPLGKAIAQSVRSDFLRDDNNPARQASTDLGIATSRFLLAKAIRNGAGPMSYSSRRIQLLRQEGGATRDRVDVYEMYWADLSRLSGQLPRIVTELFTMVFRLSKLGRETVDNARHVITPAAKSSVKLSWGVLAWLQIGLDWAFVNLLAQLFAQLLLAGLMLVLFGAVNQAPGALPVVAGVLAVFGALAAFYLGPGGGRKSLAAVVLAAGGVAMFLWPAHAAYVFGAVVLAAVSVGYDAGLRIADDRFPLVRFSGLVLWVLGLGLVCWRLVFVELEQGAAPTAHLVQSALYGVELALMAIREWWIVVALPFAAWAIVSVLAARGGHERAASATTGRLGLLASMGVFLVLSMTLWALLVTPLKWAAKDVGYTAVLENFRTTGESAAVQAAKSCPWAGARSQTPAPGSAVQACTAAEAPAAESGAQQFLRHRYENSTAAFAAIAALILVLVVHVTLTFGPSVLAELKWLRPKDGETPVQAHDASRRLGLWLTRGYRALPWTVVTIAVGGAVGAIVAAVWFGWPESALGRSIAALPIAPCLPWLSDVLLKPLVFSAAGLAAALSAFGKLLSRYLPGVRAPLDILLDVDNYLREFPRRNIPRARIFSRYAALLDHVALRGYDRIVIVAHSQGTVISAELLRLLSDSSNTPGGDRRKTLERRLNCKDIRLLTFGSPLRQLYAARFPCVYPWILAKSKDVIGPAASDVGAQRWCNGFTSGDYVGRWIWSGPSATGDPLHDGADPATPGGTEPYTPTTAAELSQSPPRGAQFEMCLGLGAHTHYFDAGQKTVATLIDHLVVAP